MNPANLCLVKPAVDTWCVCASSQQLKFTQKFTNCVRFATHRNMLDQSWTSFRVFLGGQRSTFVMWSEFLRTLPLQNEEQNVKNTKCCQFKKQK